MDWNDLAIVTRAGRCAVQWVARPGLVLVLVMVGLLSITFSSQAAAGKVQICHIPVDNPLNPQSIRVDSDSLEDHLLHGDLLGKCPPMAAEVDPPRVQVDENLEPPVQSIAGINGGPSRPLARMHSHVNDGFAFNFVANEVYLVTQNSDDLGEFMSRWPSALLNTIELPNGGTSAPLTKIYQLEVDASRAKTRKLDDDLALLSPSLHGLHEVSSEQALRLLALVATENLRQGLSVGINVLLESNEFFERVSEEAMIGINQASGPLFFEYSSNAYDWPYMTRDPDIPGDDRWPLDTGVIEALRSVEAEGMLHNRIRALILDGGFFPNEDFPPYVHIGDLRVPNPDSSGCGRGFPAPGDSSCGTHGTHSVLSGFGVPDNGFGTMGPGGAVTELITVQSPTEDVLAIIDYIIRALPEAADQQPDIINVSASAGIPGGWCPLVCPPLDLLGGVLFDLGITFVAAAGNAGKNVDALDEVCIGACFEIEAAQHIPCEVNNVVCVGAHGFFESRRTSYSNFGSYEDANSVDIFAPGNIYSVNAVQADPTTAGRDDLERITGTSFSSPFVAGVFALTKAANPTLTTAELRNCVLNTAHTDSFTAEPRRINALGAVACATGGAWPWVEIIGPAFGASFQRGEDNVSLLAETDDYEQGNDLMIHWSSSIDGALGTSTHRDPLQFIRAQDLSLGLHEVCASVLDDSGRDWSDCIDLSITSAPPMPQILSPNNSEAFSHSDTIPLLARVVDLDDSPLSVIRWEVENADSPESTLVVATGSLDTSFLAATLPLGRYILRLYVEDNTGATGTDEIQIFRSAPGYNAPDLTIDAPGNGDILVSSEGGPVTVELQATASDAEDGPIDFEDLTWWVRHTEEAFFTYVEPQRVCQFYDFTNPDLCLIWGPWTIQLEPVGSNTETEYRIRARATDSEGHTTERYVTVFVTQVII